jgi:hypothetical protein
LRSLVQELAARRLNLVIGSGQLSGSNEGRVVLRMSLDGQEPQVAAPGMAHDVDPLPAKTPTQDPGQFIGILKGLTDAHSWRLRQRVERLSGSAAIPMHNDIVLLQRSLECVREIHYRHAWTAVQKQDDRCGAIVASDENPLLNSSDLVLFQRTDAAGSFDVRCNTP